MSEEDAIAAYAMMRARAIAMEQRAEKAEVEVERLRAESEKWHHAYTELLVCHPHPYPENADCLCGHRELSPCHQSIEQSNHDLEAEVGRLREVGKRVLMVVDADLERHGLHPGNITEEGDWIHELRRLLKSPLVERRTA